MLQLRPAASCAERDPRALCDGLTPERASPWNPVAPSDRVAASGVPSILWIDDEVTPDDPSILLLTAEGFRVQCAQSAAGGLAVALSAGYDAILLDLRLPDGDGLDLLATLRAKGIHAPVLVLTGYGGPDAALLAGRLGAAGFRSKPLIGGDLVEAVRAAVGPITRSPSPAGTGWLSKDELVTRLVRALGDPNVTVPVFLERAHALRLVEAASWHRSETEIRTDVRPIIEQAMRSGAASYSPRVERAIAWLEVQPRIWQAREAALAVVLGLHRSHMGRLLRSETGLGFRPWREAVAVRAAVLQLVHSDEQIAQIAYQLGFEHPSELSRACHHLLGVSPTAFRHLLRRGRVAPGRRRNSCHNGATGVTH